MRLPIVDQAFFAQRLAFLIDGGMPLLEALAVTERQLRSKDAKRVAATLHAEVSRGRSLGDGMQATGAFGGAAVTLVSVGERCGMLGRNLQRLADEMKKGRRLRRKVLGAMAYPCIVLTATCGIVVYLLASLLPKLLPMFAELHAELPPSTRAVIALSGFLRRYGAWMAAAAVTVLGCIRLLRLRPQMRQRCELALLRVPAIGPLLRDLQLARLGRSVGTMLSGGLSLRDACALAADPGAGAYDAQLLAMAEAVNEGRSLSSHLATQPKLFPEAFTQLVASGEESGKLPEAFLYLADHYEREIDESAAGLSATLEPALMLLTGAAVGFIAIAVISPMYSLTQSLHA